MTVQIGPPPELRDQLVSSIAGHQRRRRRRLQFGVTALGVVVALALGVALATRDDEALSPVEPAATTTTRAAPPELEVLTFEATGTPAVVVATSGNRGGIAVADLEQGVTHVYPRAAQVLVGGGALSDVAVGTDHLYVFTAGTTATPGRVFRVRASLDDVDRALTGEPPLLIELDGLYAAVRVVPISEGRAWVMGPLAGGNRFTLYLLERDGSLRAVADIQGRLLSDRAGDAAIVDTYDDVYRATGWLAVRPDGGVTVLDPPASGGVLTAGDDHIVWGFGQGWSIDEPGSRIVIVERSTGSTLEVTVPEGFNWWPVGNPTIPSDSPRLATIDPANTRVLMSWPEPDNSLPSRVLALVSLDDGHVERLPLPDGARVSTAFWSADGLSVFAVVERSHQVRQQGILRIDVETGDVTDLGAVFPPGYFVVAAR
jgi:hypothetical protein